MADLFSQARQRESIASSEVSFKEPLMRLTFCIITAVNIPNRTVTIKHIGSSLEETNISYISPSANGKSGQDNIPNKGDMALIATTSAGTKIILGFIGGANRSSEIPQMEGDMLSKSLGGSIIKQDSNGNILVTVEDGSYILLTKDGDLRLYATSINVTSPHMDTYERYVYDSEQGRDFHVETKNFYESPPQFSSDLENDFEEFLAQINEGYVELEGQYPVVTQEIGGAGRHNIETLSLGMGTDYRVVKSTEIKNPLTGHVLASEKIDSNGNIKISGRVVVIEDNHPDESEKRTAVFSSSVTNIVSMTQAAYDTLTNKREDTLYIIIENTGGNPQ